MKWGIVQKYSNLNYRYLGKLHTIFHKKNYQKTLPDILEK